MRKNLSHPIFRELQAEHHLNTLLPLIQYGLLAALLVLAALVHFLAPHLPHSSAATRLRKHWSARVVAFGGWDLRGNRGLLTLVASVVLYDVLACSVGTTPGSEPDIYHLPRLRYIANRAGNLCYAHLPLVMLLVTRSNSLSTLTGVSLATLTWFHKWLGYTTFVLGLVHICYYGAFALDPTDGFAYFRMAIQKQYWFFGVVAALAFIVIVVGGTRAVRRRWHQVFLVSHIVGSVVFFGSCWLHWRPRYIFPLATIVIYASSRLQRQLSVLLNHRRARPTSTLEKLPFVSAPYEAVVQVLDERCLRVDIDVTDDVDWKAGHFVFLNFSQRGLGFMQWHPFTIASVPSLPSLRPSPASSNFSTPASGLPQTLEPERLPLLTTLSNLTTLPPSGLPTTSTPYAYDPTRPSRTITIIMTPHSSLTRRLYDLALASPSPLRTPVFIEGPYGSAAHVEPSPPLETLRLPETDTLVLIGGGTGIAFARAILQDIAQKGWSGRRILVIWSVRERLNLDWLDIGDCVDRISCTHPSIDISLHQHYTHRLGASSFLPKAGGSSFAPRHEPTVGRPDLPSLLAAAQAEASLRGSVKVMVCGPAAMCGEVVDLVAGLVDPERVARGDYSGDVQVEVDLFD